MNKRNLHVVPESPEPRIIKLGSRNRRPLLPVEQGGPTTQAEIDAVPADHTPMYTNQRFGQIISEGKVRTGWSRLILKFKTSR